MKAGTMQGFCQSPVHASVLILYPLPVLYRLQVLHDFQCFFILIVFRVIGLQLDFYIGLYAYAVDFSATGSTVFGDRQFDGVIAIG